MTDFVDSALRLHNYLVRAHWNGNALAGPDPGIRFNARVGRFIKGYLNWLPWADRLVYLQAQGYWIFDNWQLFDMLDDERYRRIALDCSDYVLSSQQTAGCWPYPNPEWRGRVATVEGCFAALGLLESYGRTEHEPYLEGAIRWFDYMISEIGFRRQRTENMWAVNYFANRNGHGGGVPNNSTLVLWLMAKLYHETQDPRFTEPCAKLVTWLNHVQLESGELPYSVQGFQGRGRTHFLCYQYNAFEFMDLVHYFQLTGDDQIWPVIERLAAYLSTGCTPTGTARYDCLKAYPEVTYYTAALAQALSQATQLGLGNFEPLVNQAFAQVLSHQRHDGQFAYHSRRNYVCLADKRSYPRYLAMVLHHLLKQSSTFSTKQNRELLGR